MAALHEQKVENKKQKAKARFNWNRNHCKYFW
jgi:hypothetical protein